MARITPGYRTTVLTMAALLAAYPGWTAGATITPVWNGNDGNWEDTTQWNPGVVPNNSGGNLYVPTISFGNAFLNTSVNLAGLNSALGSHLYVASGKILTLTGEQGSTLGGALILNSSAIAYLANVTIVGLPGAPDSISGAGDLHFTGTSNNWQTGRITGSGTAYIDALASINISGTHTSNFFLNRPLVNYGTLTANGKGTFNVAVTNYGVMNFSNSTSSDSIEFDGASNFYPFINHGTLTMTGSSLGGSFFKIPTPTLTDGLISLSSVTKPATAQFGANNVLSGNLVADGTASTFSFGNSTINNMTMSGTGLLAFPTFTSVTLLGLNSVSNINIRLLNGTGNLYVTSLLDVNDAAGSPVLGINGTVTIAPGAKFFLSNAAPTTLTTTQFVNQGVTSIPSASGSATLILNNSASFTNSGTLAIDRAMTITTTDVSNSIFNNTGTISIHTFPLTLKAPSFSSGNISIDIPTRFTASGMYVMSTLTLAGGTVGSPYNAAWTLLSPNGSGNTVNVFGMIQLAADSTIINARFGGSATLTAPIIQGPFKLTNSGGMWMAGAISSAIDVVPGSISPYGQNSEGIGSNANFMITNWGPKILNGVPLTVTAGSTLAWLNIHRQNNEVDYVLELRNGATIVNNGSFYIYSYNFNYVKKIINGDGNPNNAIFNHGTFGRHQYVSLDSVTDKAAASMQVNFFNDGFIDVQLLTLDFAGGFFDTSTPVNPSTFNVNSNASLSFSAGVVSIVSPMSNMNGVLVMNGSGQSVRGISGGGTLSVGKPLTSDGVVMKLLTVGNQGVHTIRAGGLAGGTSKLAELALATGAGGAFAGVLDLNDNKLIVQGDAAVPGDKAGKANYLQAALFSGSNGGDYLGKGITSGTVAANQSATGSHLLTLSLFDNANLNLPTFGGLAVDTNSLLIGTSLIADANFDGQIDGVDFGNWYAHALARSPFTNDGDFNHDGGVDGLDFDMWFAAVGSGGQGILDGLNLNAAALSALRADPAPVPEAGSLGILLAGVPWLLKRKSQATKRKGFVPH